MEGDLTDDFNSEIPVSSCSIPSEPPDIRNWFSSYKYESFVLDTCENFGGISSEGNESDKHESAIGKIDRENVETFDGSEEIRNVDEPEDEDSLHSLSILSEPSHIRKWYSSYVYKSPLLNTNDGFNSYVSRESECEKYEIVNEQNIKDDFANSDQSEQDASDKICSTKLVKCNSSLVDRMNESHPLFSEPLDIGNWFPDYVYESPVLDTNDEFKDTLCKDTESSQDKFDVEDSMGQKQDNFKTTTKTKCRDEVCFEKNLEPNLEFKQELSTSIIGGDSLSELNRADSQSMDISISPGKKDGKSSKKLIERKGSIADKVDIAENGFITTKKKDKIIGTNDENAVRGHHAEILLQSSRKARGGDKECGVMKRKVLSEINNVNVEQKCEATKAMEITGKWRCPQKSKPILGPPLKQLRLERWVHRV